MTVAFRSSTGAPSRAPVILRPYQRACVDAVFAYVRSAPGHPLAVLPTGAGKSLVMGSIVQEALENHPGGRALILAHRKELVEQNVRAVASVLPLGRIGIYSAGLRRKDVDTPILVAGIQSIAKKPFEIGAFDLILIDEAHLVPRTDGTMYRAFIKAARLQNPNVVFVGLTATPYRMDSGLLHRGDDALFTEICYEASVQQLIDDGYLCPLVSRATGTRLSVDGVGTRGGEFIPGQLEKAVDVAEITDAVVREMADRLHDRRKWLIFCAGVDHTEHVATTLRAAGIAAAAVHGSLDALTRAERLAAFREGTLRALTSMDVLTTGFDEPAIDAIALLRPTKSTGLYVQMVGRGFRIHPSKADTLILDFAGNVARHGPVDRIEIRETSTKGKVEAAAMPAPTKECPGCTRILHLAIAVCPECGHEFPPPPSEITDTPSDLPVLSSEPVPATWHDLSGSVLSNAVEYFRHEKPGKPKSLRVEYYAGQRRLASEWVCLEHGGFARHKAEIWWREHARTRTEPPLSVEEALVRIGELREPIAIATKPDGKYTRVVGVRFEEEEAVHDDAEASPRPCISCQHFLAHDGAALCLKWNTAPPEEVQPVGCEAFELLDDEDLPF